MDNVTKLEDKRRLRHFGKVQTRFSWSVLQKRARFASELDNLKILVTPFLPFTSQKLHELLGYAGYLAGPLLFREYTEADGSSHRVLTGDYETWVGAWAPSALPPGQKLQQPAPLFKKLDESVVAEELARLGVTS